MPSREPSLAENFDMRDVIILPGWIERAAMFRNQWQGVLRLRNIASLLTGRGCATDSRTMRGGLRSSRVCKLRSRKRCVRVEGQEKIREPNSVVINRLEIGGFVLVPYDLRGRGLPRAISTDDDIIHLVDVGIAE